MTDRKESLIDYYTLRHLKSKEAALNAAFSQMLTIVISYWGFAAFSIFMAFACEYWLCLFPGVFLLIMAIVHTSELRRISKEQKSINEKISNIMEKM